MVKTSFIHLKRTVVYHSVFNNTWPKQLYHYNFDKNNPVPKQFRSKQLGIKLIGVNPQWRSLTNPQNLVSMYIKFLSRCCSSMLKTRIYFYFKKLLPLNIRLLRMRIFIKTLMKIPQNSFYHFCYKCTILFYKDN